MNAPNQTPARWSEARASRLVAMVVSGAVVVSDLVLLIFYLRAERNIPGGWREHWYIPAGIVGILFFAGARFRRHWEAFHAPPPVPGEEGE